MNSSCGRCQSCPLRTQLRKAGLALMGSLEETGSPIGIDLLIDSGEVRASSLPTHSSSRNHPQTPFQVRTSKAVGRPHDCAGENEVLGGGGHSDAPSAQALVSGSPRSCKSGACPPRHCHPAGGFPPTEIQDPGARAVPFHLSGGVGQMLACL